MATIEITLPSEHLNPSQVEVILQAIAEETTAPLEIGNGEDSIVVDSRIDDDVFIDFRDRLDANELDADIYLPLDFEAVVEVGEYRVGSTHALQLVLDTLREDFSIEDFEDDEEEELDEVADMDVEVDEEHEDAEHDEYERETESRPFDEELGGEELKDEQLRHVWRLLHRAAKESIESKLALVLTR